MIFRSVLYGARLLIFLLFSVKLSAVLRGTIKHIFHPFSVYDSPSQRFGYASALQIEYSGLDQLLHDTRFLPALSHDLAIGVIAIEDLLKIVKSSSLDGAEVLADNMEHLRTEAKTTAQHLHGLQVKVDGLIDRIFGVSVILSQSLETRSMTSTAHITMCNIFRSATAFSSTCQAVHHLPLIFQTFLDMLEQGIVRLIFRAKELEGALSRLEERLITIRDIASGEAKIHLHEKDELLHDLWTRFGGNRRQLSLLNRNLRALKLIYEYHGLADRCVASTQAELETMREALEDLRPLASAPLLVASDLSVEMVMEQIKTGAERLRAHQRDVEEIKRTESAAYRSVSTQVFDP